MLNHVIVDLYHVDNGNLLKAFKQGTDRIRAVLEEINLPAVCRIAGVERQEMGY